MEKVIFARLRHGDDVKNLYHVVQGTTYVGAKLRHRDFLIFRNRKANATFLHWLLAKNVNLAYIFESLKLKSEKSSINLPFFLINTTFFYFTNCAENNLLFWSDFSTLKVLMKQKCLHNVTLLFTLETIFLTYNRIPQTENVARGIYSVKLERTSEAAT